MEWRPTECITVKNVQNNIIWNGVRLWVGQEYYSKDILISCRDSKIVYYIIMGLSTVDIIIAKEYINRTGCSNGLEKKQTVILVGLKKRTIQCGVQKGHRDRPEKALR